MTWLLRFNGRLMVQIAVAAGCCGAAGYSGRWWLRRVWFSAPVEFPPRGVRVDDFQTVEVNRRACRHFAGQDVVVRYHIFPPGSADSRDRPPPGAVSPVEPERVADRRPPPEDAIRALLSGFVPRVVLDKVRPAAKEAAGHEARYKFASMTLEPSKAPSPQQLVSNGTVPFGENAGRQSFLAGVFDAATDQSFVKCATGYVGGPDPDLAVRTCVPDGTVLVPPYLRVMLAAVAFLPFPLDANLRVAALGVAGGALPSYLQHNLSTRIGHLDLVDVEPAVLEAAIAHMGLSGDKLRRGCTLHVKDAETFLRETSTKQDILFVDLFSGARLAPVVKQEAFVTLCRESLATAGVVAFNLPSSDPQFVQMCRRCFGESHVFVAPVPHGSNVVVFAAARMPDETARRHVVGRATTICRDFHLKYDLGAHLPMSWCVW